MAQAAAQPQGASRALARLATFDDVVALIRANRDVQLLVEVETGVRLAAYQPGRIEFTPTPEAAPDLAARLARHLQRWTGARWAVTVVNDAAAPTIAETRDAAENAARARAAEHPLVRAALEAFPQARIAAVRTREEIIAQAADAALPEAEEAGEDWDPFEA